jgi:hypothetical protein
MLQQSVDSYRSALGNENAKLALALGDLGFNQSMSGNFAAGKVNAQLGLDMARKCGDAVTLAKCLHCCALAGRGYGMRPASENVPLLREAVALWRQLGNNPAWPGWHFLWVAPTKQSRRREKHSR